MDEFVEDNFLIFSRISGIVYTNMLQQFGSVSHEQNEHNFATFHNSWFVNRQTEAWSVSEAIENPLQIECLQKCKMHLGTYQIVLEALDLLDPLARSGMTD